ncbi:protein fem-1 homolog CG6966-like [Watersipora subatra]|uniref:protein fem-1 homolog CG6966-like n=1 Tax=Watersipora subatra TaxID=2589382 RepID=UPI00355C96AA
MDWKALAYAAARDGEVDKLKDYVGSKPVEELKPLINYRTENGDGQGATPLVMAAKNGHYEVVQYLIENCGADVEFVGSVTFDGETIDGAPPLWCAAAAGHLNIVKYLIDQCANVNNTTLTNSTPLRAACFDGHFEIVKYLVEHQADIEIANRHGHTCLMISCYKGHLEIVSFLLDTNADVNRKSVKGNTALHDCAESGSLEIMELLLLHNAKMDKDAYGMTPLFAAAVTGHMKIVEFLIRRDEVLLIERIEALELLGATFVDKKRDMAGAMRYWKRALELRNCDSLNPITKPVAPVKVSAYEGATEIETVNQLEDLMADHDGMRMQALLVRERILGPAHPDTSYYIRYRGAVYADMGDFDRCIALWMYALDMQMSKLDALSPMTQSSLLSFAELFSFMMGTDRRRTTCIVKVFDICSIFSKAIIELERGQKVLMGTTALPTERDTQNYSRIVIIILHIMSLICRLTEKMTENEKFNFKQRVYKLIKMEPRSSKGQTLLHLAVSSETTNVGKYPVCTFPCLDCIELLLELDASVEVLDLQSNSALHVACMQKKPDSKVVLALLRTGAHIDWVNVEGKRPLDHLDASSPDYKSLVHTIMPQSYTSLQCLAAKVIKRHYIRYRGRVPRQVQAFIDKLAVAHPGCSTADPAVKHGSIGTVQLKGISIDGTGRAHIKNRAGTSVLNGTLRDIKDAKDQKLSSCSNSDSEICLTKENGYKLRITPYSLSEAPAVQCYNITQSYPPSAIKSNISTCFAYGVHHWYGAAEDSVYQGINNEDLRLSLDICNEPNLTALHVAMADHFWKKPEARPALETMVKPIWSTWAEYKKDINESLVMEYADKYVGSSGEVLTHSLYYYRILEFNMSISQLEIDDDWTSHYGDWQFSPTKFPNAASTMALLKTKVPAVSVWIHPFINTDADAFSYTSENNMLMKINKVPGLTTWWNSGFAGLLDFSYNETQFWFLNKMKDLQRLFHIDSFKFDAGETVWIPHFSQSFQRYFDPSEYVQHYVTVAVEADKTSRRQEVRVGWRTQSAPILVRMLDRRSRWGTDNGLKTLIPTALTFGILGYPFVLPDMIGGNAYEGVEVESELYIRWLQINVFLPAIQFSIPPWHFNDSEIVKHAQDMLKLRESHLALFDRLSEEAVTYGWPMVRPLWWIDPSDTVCHNIADEFLLGNDLLVAPIVEKGWRSRDVYLPAGKWLDQQNNKELEGSTWYKNYTASLWQLPYFTRIFFK